MFHLSAKKGIKEKHEKIDENEKLEAIMEEALNTSYNVLMIGDTEGNAILRGIRYSKDDDIDWIILTTEAEPDII